MDAGTANRGDSVRVSVIEEIRSRSPTQQRLVQLVKELLALVRKRKAEGIVSRVGTALMRRDAKSMVRKRRKKTEDSKLKQVAGMPKKVKKAARVIHKFGMKRGYFPNL